MTNDFENAIKAARYRWTRKGHSSEQLIGQLARDFAVEYLVAENAFFDAVAEYPESEEVTV
jgi:hypothetical protein